MAKNLVDRVREFARSLDQKSLRGGENITVYQEIRDGLYATCPELAPKPPKMTEQSPLPAHLREPYIAFNRFLEPVASGYSRSSALYQARLCGVLNPIAVHSSYVFPKRHKR